MPELEFFVALETKVWQALTRGDAAADARLLTDDFLGVYPTGFATRDDHVGQLGDGPTVGSYKLSEARLFTVVDDAVMLSYRASFTGPQSTADATPKSMYVSSLWCLRDGEWRNVFSQDTPAATD